MKIFDEILKDERVVKIYKNVNLEKVQRLKIAVKSKKENDIALVMLTNVEGWEHLSVSFKNKIPSWECMEEMKRLCFKDDEECFQLHPKLDNYVNNNEYALHIWRPAEGMKQIPPSILVGYRQNHIEEDRQAALELHKRIGTPIPKDMLDIIEMCATEEGVEKAVDKLQDNPELLIRIAEVIGII